MAMTKTAVPPKISIIQSLVLPSHTYPITRRFITGGFIESDAALAIDQFLAIDHLHTVCTRYSELHISWSKDLGLSIGQANAW